MAEYSNYNLIGNQFEKVASEHRSSFILPDNHVILSRTPLTYRDQNEYTWDNFFEACGKLQKQIDNPAYVFLDASWDPVREPNQTLVHTCKEVAKIFSKSRVYVLSAKAQHFYDNLPGVVYFPMFLLANYGDLNFRPRAGRFGCLNRRNAAHRVWLMHTLLEQNLISPELDSYSVSFVGLDNSRWDVEAWLGPEGLGFNQAQLKWPAKIQTHPDDFPNDYTINHPAWHTGISIITETESGEDTIVCEKTGKGILSKSCFSIYMSEAGYRVLEDLGFEPRFFLDHAEDRNIEPILKICREIKTESDALDYRQQHIDKINHNFEWFGYTTQFDLNFKNRPWFNTVRAKLQQGFDSL